MFAAIVLICVSLTSLSHAQMWSGRKQTRTEDVSPQLAVQPEIELFPNGKPIHIERVPSGIATATAQSCNGCHFAIHDDWSQSAHASAGRSTAYRDAVHRAANSTACTQCHQPLVAQHANLATGYIDGDLARPILQPNPAFDATFLAEGVGCAACHVRDGLIVSTRDVLNSPHPVVKSNELANSSFCANCHQLSFPESDQPFYNTYGEWKATPYASNGVRCQDCHMPPKAGAATATRFAASPDHTISAHLSRALTVLVDLEHPTLQRGASTPIQITVLNTGAAHHVPTGNPSNALDLKVGLFDEEGAPVTEQHQEVLARTVQTDPPYTTTSDTRIPAGGQHRFTASFTAPHKAKPGPIELRVTGSTGNKRITLLSVPMELR